MENLESGRSDVAPVQQMSSPLLPVPFPGEMYTRRAHAILLRNGRRLCQSSQEEKICISHRGAVTDWWHENLYGFTRVVVHGVDSLCVVARTEDLDHALRQVKEAKRRVSNLPNALIYEAEDLALPCGELGKMTSRSIEKPFVAVSVIPGTNGGHEASSAGYHLDSAIKFLKDEMDNGATISYDRSVKTAIFTLQHLFGKKFKANEIRVFYVKNYHGLIGEKANEIPTRGERCLMDHVAVINNPRTCGGSYSRKRTLAVINKPRSTGSSSGRKRRRLGVVNKSRNRGSDSGGSQ